MQPSTPWNAYRQVATQTAQPGQLVVMLYEGAIRFLERARLGFQEEDPLLFNSTINNNILRASAIINELNASLDMKAGGEFSLNQRRIYQYMERRLQESNRRKQEPGLVEIIGLLTTLRNAWAEMLRRQAAGYDEDAGRTAVMALS